MSEPKFFNIKCKRYLQYPQGRFLESTGRSTSTPTIRWVPRPPPAAPAAGGRGSLVFSSVCSVGLCRFQPAASGRWRRGRSGLLERRLSSSVVMLCGASSPAARSSLGRRSSEMWCELPVAGDRVAAVPAQLKFRADVVCCFDATGDARWRIFGSEERRLPVRTGVPPVPRPEGRWCGGAASCSSSLASRSRRAFL
jgi:hypothetical protein